jgi:Holliday junction resolvase
MPKRVDDTQKEIVEALREGGASVQIISDIGRGCPDIIVGMHGRNYLVEIKNGRLQTCKQKLTKMEADFFESWKGQVCVINSIDAVVEFLANPYK